jgi:pyridoxamine 5'-phosphate oxidase
MLHDIRKQYEFSALTEENAFQNPFEQFSSWLQQALESEELEPTAMILSTVDIHNQPHSRVVLLKDFNTEGLVFFTNYEGNKAIQLDKNNKVSIVFFWQSLERQVRITGEVEKLSEQTSDLYFKSRPLDSQIGAWTSPQSRVIPSAEYLEESFLYFQNKFGNDVPKPPHWGGYLIRPASFEFWQGRPNRLHDRLYYSTDENEVWKIERLAP